MSIPAQDAEDTTNAALALMSNLAAVVSSCRAALSIVPLPSSQSSSSAPAADLVSWEFNLTRLQQTSDEIEHIRRLLLYHRNCSPGLIINKLPDDVLAMVFCEASRRDSFSMFALSQVCTRWRYLALRTPKMWSAIELGLQKTRFDTLPENLIRLVLDRSRDADMAVFHFHEDLLPSRYHAASLDTMLQSCSSRLVDLSIKIEARASECSLLSDLPAPALQRLMITARLTSRNLPVILPRICAGQTPKLETIHLRGMRLPWDPTVFPTRLKELVVDEEYDLWSHHGSYWDPESRLQRTSIDKYTLRHAQDRSIVAVLRHCASLEVVSISRCSNLRCGPKPSVGDSAQPASLPYLRTLILRNSILDSAHILEAIDASGIQKLTVQCDVLTSWSGDDRTTSPGLHHLPRIVFDHLALARSMAIDDCCLYASYSGTGHTGPNGEPNICIKLFCAQLQLTGSLMGLQDASLPHVRYLRFMRCISKAETVHDAVLHDWPDYIISLQSTCLSNLQHFSISGFTTAHDSGATRRWDPTSGDILRVFEQDQHSGILLRQLRTLEIKNCDVSRHDYHKFFLRCRELVPTLRFLRVVDTTFDILPSGVRIERDMRRKFPHVVWENVREASLGSNGILR